MTNHINLLGFDQSTSFTGVFAGQYDLDNPLKAPRVILWETIGRKLKKNEKPDPLRSSLEIRDALYKAARHSHASDNENYVFDAVACEDGYIDWTKPKVGLSIKMAQGWVDAIIATQYNKPVHHFMPRAWRTIWGPHSLSGTDAFKKHSITLAQANLKYAQEPDVLTDHMADAFWITCHLFKQIVDGVITI